MALKVNGQVLDETICIFRENPFQKNADVTCIASLCQDHPFEARNRFSKIFANLSRKLVKAKPVLLCSGLSVF